MHAHGGIAEPGLGPSRREDDELPAKFTYRIFKGPEAAAGVLGVGFVVGHRRLELGVPVDQALAAEDVAVAEPVEEGDAHRPRAALIQGEARARPVAATAHLGELAEDA